MEKQFKITRTFNAPLELVWKANTEKDRLVQWWGPKELTMLEATMDFRPGGVFHYGMQMPGGQIMWGKFTYREIVPMQKIVFVNAFSDANAGISRHPMAPEWPAEILSTMEFSEENGKTTITITGQPINATQSEMDIYFSNFESINQGFGGTFDQLDAYLETVK